MVVCSSQKTTCKSIKFNPHPSYHLCLLSHLLLHPFSFYLTSFLCSVFPRTPIFIGLSCLPHTAIMQLAKEIVGAKCGFVRERKSWDIAKAATRCQRLVCKLLTPCSGVEGVQSLNECWLKRDPMAARPGGGTMLPLPNWGWHCVDRDWGSDDLSNSPHYDQHDQQVRKNPIFSFVCQFQRWAFKCAQTSNDFVLQLR